MRKDLENGFIEYRMPNIPESFDFLDASGIDTQTANKEWIEKNIWKILKGMSLVIKPLILKVEIKEGDKIISTIDELMGSGKYMNIIKDICMEIFVEINGGDSGNLQSSGV